MRTTSLVFFMFFLVACTQNLASPESELSPRQPVSEKQLVYFGDSQAVLWLGPVIGEYFSSISQTCRLKRSLRGMNVYGYATGSSAFKHWVASGGPNRQHMCGRKPHSAIIRGSRKKGGLTFARSRPEICQSPSAVEGVFDIHPKPSFVVVNFLGNAAYDSRRVNNRAVVGVSDYQFDLKAKFQDTNFDLLKQVKQFVATIPRGVPCMVMTTTPNRLKKSVQRQRIHAQAVIERAVEESGRCSFVRGITPEIDARFASTKAFHGDSYHVSTAGAQWWLSQLTPDICSAMNEAVNRAH